MTNIAETVDWIIRAVGVTIQYETILVGSLSEYHRIGVCGQWSEYTLSVYPVQVGNIQVSICCGSVKVHRVYFIRSEICEIPKKI